ncbi:hypothetical protein WICMUC_003824 [Wickerhamomyces mucosus]|uniref:VPS9 domain-containing protein n=1 Tax=Wickerhamomyces mucosus TaxID=1378264 RepID=A0A9P8TCG7_9ASCO|nr:hypothetical protein WICMUC_003824 [Wickerhamomyces mucosus]
MGSSHLPLLLHPLINSIFNNPHPTKSPLNEVYDKISRTWNEGLFILVPPLNILLNYYDKDTGVSYSDLCYSEEFVSNHIIVTNEIKSAKIFSTLNNKEVLIKKDIIFTGRNFNKSLKINIQHYDYFRSYNSYFEKGRKFMLIYIEEPLFGIPSKINLLIPSSPKTERTFSAETRKQQTTETETALFSSGDYKPNGFEQIMRAFPLVSKNLGEKYENLFQSFTVKEVQNMDSLFQVFTQNSNLASHIFQTLNQDVINSIFDRLPNLDLNECIHNYVEINLYDKVWNCLCNLNSDFMKFNYESLSDLSLNQISLPIKFKTDLHILSRLEQNVSRAINILSELQFTTDSTSKLNIFIQVISQLSNAERLIIDADTLVGLLLMVIVRSGIPDIESHLFYAQKFSFQDTESGIVGYSLSTIEGVLYYLKDTDNMESLREFSKNNDLLRKSIKNKELVKLKKAADIFSGEHDSSLKSRTGNGESLLMLAVQSSDYDIWKLLIDYEEIYPLEDILLDRNTNRSNLLNVALNLENFEIVDDIIDILLTSCTLNELKMYFNDEDVHGRTIGHYLFHFAKIIPKVSPFIDWLKKDKNGQTPLFTICRSYDSSNYDDMIETAFREVDRWYKYNKSEFDYEDHMDKRGNTLLHIIGSHADILLKKERNNINEGNARGFTPLMIYSKYNRIENIETILKNPDIEVSKPENKNFTAIDQSKNDKVSNLIDKRYLNENITKVEKKQIGAIKVILDINQWKLIIRGVFNNRNYQVSRTFNEFKSFIELVKIEFSNSFLPLDYVLKTFDIVLNFSNVNKMKLNKLIEEINMFLQSTLLNRALINYDLLWWLLTEPDFDLLALSRKKTLETLKEKQTLNGKPLRSTVENEHDFSLKPEEIGEINFFLKFSLKELSKLKSTYNMLFKIVNFQSTKSKELIDFIAVCSLGRFESVKELDLLCKLYQDYCKEYSFDDGICGRMLFLSLSGDEIVKKINHFISVKIFNWWKLYGELIELNNAYKKFKSVELRNRRRSNEVNIEDNSISNGTQAEREIVDINEESFSDLTRSTHFSLYQSSTSNETVTQRLKKQQPSFFTNFIESKRKKFEQKSVESMNHIKYDLAILGKEIKVEHETLAIEINNFFIYKSEFLKLVLEKYAKKQINDWEFQTKMLMRGLYDIKSIE